MKVTEITIEEKEMTIVIKKENDNSFLLTSWYIGTQRQTEGFPITCSLKDYVYNNLSDYISKESINKLTEIFKTIGW